MKVSTIILGVIGALVATAGLYKMTSSQVNQEVPEHVRQMWINWKLQHQTGYGASAEESYRLHVFYDNYKKVNELNAKGGATYELNQFADLPLEEFRANYMGYNYEEEEGPRNVHKFDVTDVPREVDWAQKGAVNTPQQQGKCGGCYSFAASAALEALGFINSGVLPKLSQQQIIECSRGSGYMEKGMQNNGCHGGRFQPTFRYTSERGLHTRDEYPYKMSDTDRCDKTIENSNVKKYNSWYKDVAANSNEQMMAALSQQPVGIGVNADGFQHYKGGVMTEDCDPYHLNHAVLAVGYGVDSTTNQLYYKIKNSWGSTYGEGGFIRVERTVKDGPGKCGMLISPTYPTA